jgi:hypothetical protein
MFTIETKYCTITLSVQVMHKGYQQSQVNNYEYKMLIYNEQAH